jgi:hypothetical protein
VLRAPNEEFLTIKNFFTTMGIALGFEAGMIMLYKIRLRPKAWVMGSGFVVHLARKKEYGF